MTVEELEKILKKVKVPAKGFAFLGEVQDKIRDDKNLNPKDIMKDKMLIDRFQNYINLCLMKYSDPHIKKRFNTHNSKSPQTKTNFFKRMNDSINKKES